MRCIATQVWLHETTLYESPLLAVQLTAIGWLLSDMSFLSRDMSGCYSDPWSQFKHLRFGSNQVQCLKSFCYSLPGPFGLEAPPSKKRQPQAILAGPVPCIIGQSFLAYTLLTANLAQVPITSAGTFNAHFFGILLITSHSQRSCHVLVPRSVDKCQLPTALPRHFVRDHPTASCDPSRPQCHTDSRLGAKLSYQYALNTSSFDHRSSGGNDDLRLSPALWKY
ncbi:putative protein FAM19A1 [Triplophysa rosa]|uniref:Uncharacterized protein n=1 Tax=Triplophysa rosa TaxID=992332 RepID=A0A9W7WCE4_TRIRA|nr:putative protein FAM19A1 [Triplophysa rosa]